MPSLAKLTSSRHGRTDKIIHKKHGESRRRERKVRILQSLKLCLERPKTWRRRKNAQQKRVEFKRLVCNRLRRPSFVPQHGDIAIDCRFSLALSQSGVTAVVETVEAETLDFGPGICYGKRAGARGEPDGDVGVGFWGDSESFIEEVWGADAEVRVRNALIDAHRGSPGECGTLEIIKLEEISATWT